MCERITQYMTVAYYPNILGMPVKNVDEQLYHDLIGNYNAGPVVRHWTLRRTEEAFAMAESFPRSGYRLRRKKKA